MRKRHVIFMTLLTLLLPVFSVAADLTLPDQGQLYAQLDSQKRGQEEYREVPPVSPWGDIHKYAGYTSAVLAGITAVSSGNESFHEAAAYATAAAAMTTVVSGAVEYGDRFDLKDGLFAEDNRHVLAGTLGALLMVTAVAIADDGEEGGHSTLGIAGGALMGVALIDIKW